jgi:hypothetical protein
MKPSSAMRGGFVSKDIVPIQANVFHFFSDLAFGSHIGGANMP